MDYKKVGIVSSVVLAYSGFSASISVEATTVSTDSFNLQDEQEKPVDLTIKQPSQETGSSSIEESTGSTESTEQKSSDTSETSESSTSTTSSPTENSTTASSTTSSSSKPAATKPSTSTSSTSSGKSTETTRSKEKDTKSTETSDKKEEKKEKIPTIIAFSPNYSTQQFVNQIAEQARTLGQERDLYASVMIAQAILESGSGNSGLASPPNHNLFGIKGSYGGKTVRFETSEDDGSGKLHKVKANFRKYSSYKESLEDYADLLSRNLYSGARKSSTSSYQDATKYLTGRYATDTSYGAKLNGLIEAYDLAQYDYPADQVPEKVAAEDKKQSKVTKKITKEAKQEDEKVFEAEANVEQEYTLHEVQSGESLKKISEQYQISIADLVELNQLNRYVLMVGQVLKIEPVVRPSQIDQTLIESDTRYKQDILINKKITEVIPESVFKALDLRYKITATSAVPVDSYKVERGDSLLSISKKVGLSVQSLREWNQLEGYLLREGQVLRITPTLEV
ncbi:hypothetical protein IGI37_003275 [Enterococcus sp. AZ194]|uniref:glucosaminidase domain-containing protein n=1 Tax=Enterococcus sp. AZ194 TaxID=2774629 RepID=UPI003F246972